MKDAQKRLVLAELIQKELDGFLADEEFDHLQCLLNDDTAAVNYYVESILSISAFSENMMVSSFEVIEKEYLQEDLSECDLWMSLAKEEMMAPAIQIPKEKPQRELIQKVVYPPREKRKMSKFSIFSFVMSAAAMVFMALFVKFAPVNKYGVEVATLVDQVNVKWAQSDTNLEIGGRLWTDEGPLDLKNGIVKLQYDGGVEVLIEGPAVFEIERSGVYLEYGRLYCRVSETGLGFTVETPASQFIDHGTEFGVQSDVNGSAELHVMKGKVQFFAGSKGSSKAGQMVVENTAARYNSNTGQIKAIPVAKKAFVRHIDSKTKTIWRGQTEVDLADIVSGGNGLMTTTQPVCIRAHSGEIRLQSGRDNVAGDFTYHPVDNIFVDGVFVPSIGQGLPKVSSAGHEFSACPSTNNANWGSLFNTKYLKENEIPDNMNLMGGLEKVKSNSLFMHSNGGITVDLDAVRTSYQSSIKEFRAGYLFNNRKRVGQGDLYIDFWILIDGQVRYQKTDVTVSDTVFPIQIPISDQDRFLSLVVTDGSDDSTDNVWGFFVEPVLTLEND